MVNNFSFVGHIISVATMQLCGWSKKVAIGNMKTNKPSCVPIKFYLWALNLNFILVSRHEIFFLILFYLVIYFYVAGSY